MPFLGKKNNNNYKRSFPIVMIDTYRLPFMINYLFFTSLSVCALETRSYKAGDEITMRLMKREKGSTYAMPADQWQPKEKPHHLTGTVLPEYYSIG